MHVDNSPNTAEAGALHKYIYPMFPISHSGEYGERSEIALPARLHRALMQGWRLVYIRLQMPTGMTTSKVFSFFVRCIMATGKNGSGSVNLYQAVESLKVGLLGLKY